MKKWMKKAIAATLVVSLLCPGAGWTREAKEVKAAEVSSAQQHFEVLTADELTEDMGAGWNLGNTMDGHTGFTPGETEWQKVLTTKKLIQSIHDMGFNTIRIPVTWGTMIDDENDYAIDAAWLSRVQDIVDYCMSLDMYAIINIHHDGVAKDGGWLSIGTPDQEALEAKFAGVWKHIATAFKDYDEHLIFEAMNEVQNEVKGVKMTVAEENQVIMKLNQIFVNTVRGTGSNNEQRWLMVAGKFNYVDSVCNPKNEFSLPEDTVENRLIVSVHIYTPSGFCLGEYARKESDYTYSVDRLATNDREVQPLYENYTSKGVPVVVGEYGCMNKDYPIERAFYLEGMNRIFRKYKCVGVYWDNGYHDRSKKPDYGMAIFNRTTCESLEKEVADSLLRGALGLGGETDYSTLEKDPEIVPVTSLASSVTSVELGINETASVDVSYEPEDSNDVILWKSQDPSVATVAYGKIHGKGVGSTVVTAFTQNGTAAMEIAVTVNPEVVSHPCTEISLEKDFYGMAVKDVGWLQPKLAPEGTEETVYYTSSNEDVVTVSSIGKMVAVGVGEATVAIHTTGGMTKEIPVQVQEKPLKDEIQLAVNVYYNDSPNKYFSNEVSQDVQTITKNGQYTLTFDCDRDLSQAAKDAGVKGLEAVGSIYIKDYQVTAREANVSPLKQCTIRYDSITVDGVALTINDNTPKSALKDSGIFDTNDPINMWDGTVVDGMSPQGGALGFSMVENPKTISITFTLSDMIFLSGTVADTLSTTEPENPQEPNVSAQPDASAQPGPTTPAAIEALQKGDTFQSGGGEYKVSDASEKGKVTYVAPKKKTITSAKIPAKVTYQGKSYTVNVIGAKAFNGCKKLKTVTIGTNIQKIEKKAFYGCSKLKKITVNTKKLKSVGDNAIGKIAPKAVIKVPKSKKKAYKKLFGKKAGYKKSMKLAG